MADHLNCVPMDHHNEMVQMFRKRLAEVEAERDEWKEAAAERHIEATKRIHAEAKIAMALALNDEHRDNAGSFGVHCQCVGCKMRAALTSSPPAMDDDEPFICGTHPNCEWNGRV